MILRNGINSTLRARGRSALFAVLILVLTVALTLGIGTWAYSSQLLHQMDKSYTSIAVVEYKGTDYPNVDAADVYAREAAATLERDVIQNIEGVQLWEPTDRTLATVNGYTRLTGDVPYEDYGVLICTSFVPVYITDYLSITEDDLPELYIAIDIENFTAKMKFSTDEETGWVRYYYEAAEEGYHYHYYDEDRFLIEGYTHKDELPREYIYCAQTSGSRYPTYVYVKDGVAVQALVKSASPDENIYFEYSPESNLYYGTGKVIRSYTGICVDPLYSREYSDDFLMTLQTGQDGLQIEPGKRYIVHGMFSADGNNLNNFILVPFEDESKITSWQEITDGEYDAIFDKYAKKYAVANSFVRLESSANVSVLEVFQQDVLRLETGRFPYTAEKNTCVVSHDIALQLDLEIGSTIDLTVLDSNANDRFELTESENKTLEIVGITTINEDYTGCVWVSDAEGNYASPLFGYQLGHAVLDNSTARKAADRIEQMCGDNVRVTLCDQGYSAAAQPLRTMRSTAMAITIAACCATAAVLMLFGFLFVGKQKEAVQVLVSLGTPKKQIRLWLLSGASVICAFAAITGSLIGGISINNIITLALNAASGLYAADQRYSEAANGYVKEVMQIDYAPLWPAIISGIGIFVVALSLCAAFLNLARRQNTPQRGKQTIRVPKGGTSILGTGAFRFAVLSAKRGGWRSAIVPVAGFVLSLLLGILAMGTQSWNEQVDMLYRDTRIIGSVVSTNGRQDTGLQISASSARTLWKSQLLDDVSVSLGWNYWLEDETPDFGTGEFAEYRIQEWISKQPKLIALNDLRAAPEFMHGLSPDISWIEGYDSSILSGNEYHPFMTTRFYGQSGAILKQENEEIAYPCIVTQQFLDRRGIQLGEQFTVTMQFDHYPWDEERYVRLYPVGVFNQTCAEDNIYLPLSFWCDPAWVNGDTDILLQGERPTIAFRTNEDRDKYLYSTTNFETCVFTLRSATELEQLRDYLTQQRFSQVRNLNSNRTTILLRDQTFVETIEGLGRYISFSRFLFPALFAVVVLLGFVISWLMINGRRMEFAILRGLGASRTRVFFSFFLEQLLLCFTGSAISVAGMLILTGINTSVLLAVLIFLLCYLTGCALSILMVGKTNLMSLLSERE